MKVPIHPSLESITIEQILFALSDSLRLTIFKSLFEMSEEKSCSYFDYLAKKNNLSHHYKILRENGVIRVRGEGRYRYLSLRKEELDHKFPHLLETIYNNSQSQI